MSFVYIVVMNSDEELPGGGVFPTAYTNFEEAKVAALEKYQDELNQERMEFGKNMASDVDGPESKSGLTHLYIEKGINIYIHKLPIKKSGGRKTRRGRRQYRN
jgi:hypothetical protein